MKTANINAQCKPSTSPSPTQFVILTTANTFGRAQELCNHLTDEGFTPSLVTLTPEITTLTSEVLALPALATAEIVLSFIDAGPDRIQYIDLLRNTSQQLMLSTLAGSLTFFMTGTLQGRPAIH